VSNGVIDIVAKMSKLSSVVGWIEEFLFSRRYTVMAAFLAVTAVMAYFAVQLRMDAGFEKQIPVGHEYTQTYAQYKQDLFGANRVTVVVKARSGTIWTQAQLQKLYQVTRAVQFLPNVDRLGVQSLWTPNSYVNEITEEGFRADPIISGTTDPNALTAPLISSIRQSTIRGGYVGTLVARDESSAMITADLDERDAKGQKLDYVEFNHLLEAKIRQPFEDANTQIEIVGFAKQIGDIADGASSVLRFCGIALLLTALAVYWYCRSVRFTILPIVCSLTSLIWQFGALRLLGFSLDPLGVLVPFLIFSIGVSHGVQQINFITRELASGKSFMHAARGSFSGLLIPGTLALSTAFVSFLTLLLIPIPMVRELATTASLGVAFKIVTNLIMLPLAASMFGFGKATPAVAVSRKDVSRARWLHKLSHIAEPRNAIITLLLAAGIFGCSVWESRDRVIGTLQPGVPELRENSRFNLDAVAISGSYDVGLDWLSVVFETPADACTDARVGLYEDDFATAMQGVQGVVSVASYPQMLRNYNEGYNEGNPKMFVVPIDPANYGGLSAEIGRVHGYVNKGCTMTATHLYLADHKATTINRVIAAVKAFRDANHSDGIKIRLAAGNAGVLAAINDEVQHSELPMMLYVYASIICFVFLAYRDLRAVVACCAPLTLATFIGYWFMKELHIGLTVATLPVMVLAVGVGVDYAFYIYNRLQYYMANDVPIVKAMEQSIEDVGVATIFTAITLALGVATWSFSSLKFQADMGTLLAFMFIVNLVMAMTVLPALVVVLERVFPRRTPVTISAALAH
jgi:predicted RND superfamily exporter protein